MANELRYIDFTDRGTMTARLGSLTSNASAVTVTLVRRTGGYVGSLPSGLSADLYGVRYQSADGKVDEYDEIDTRIVTGDGFTQNDRDKLIELASTQINGRFTSQSFVNFPSGGTIDTGAIATAVQNQIKPQLDSIEDLAELSALPVSADSIVVNPANAIATYTQGGATKLRVQLLGALGEPNADEVRQQLRLPT
jgi:hypothetical protein